MTALRTMTYMLTFAMVAGCAATRSEPDASTQNSQRMATTFKRDGVKLEWSCKWGTGITKATCVKGDFIGIEVSAYAPSVANDLALAKLAQFLSTEVKTSRTTKILTRNLEKTNQMLLSGKTIAGEVTFDDDETPPARGSNEQALQTDSSVASSVVEVLTIKSQRILKGVRVIDEKIVDAKTVSVTVRWDAESEDARQEIDKAMSR